MYLLNWRNPEVRRDGKTTSITINTPGIYDGLDIEDMTLTQYQTPITLGAGVNGQLVRIRGSRIKTSGQCLRDQTGGRTKKVMFENSLLMNGMPVVNGEGYGRIADVQQPELLIFAKCDFVDHGGVKVAGGGGAGAVGTVMMIETRSLNIQSLRGNGAGGLQVPTAGLVNHDAITAWRQFIQITGANLPAKILISWCESVNQWGLSMPGDDYSIIDCIGTSGNPIIIDDCLADGGYGMYQYSVADANGSFRAYQASPAGNRLNYSGTGFMIETGSGGSSYVYRRRGVVIAHSNGGVYTYGNSSNNLIDAFRVVSSGLAPDGTKLAGAFNPGLYSTDSVTSTTYSNNYSRWMRASPNTNPLSRTDLNLGVGTTSTSNDAPNSGAAVTLADEQAARDFWLAKKRAAGIYPGSSWLASPGGY